LFEEAEEQLVAVPVNESFSSFEVFRLTSITRGQNCLSIVVTYKVIFWTQHVNILWNAGSLSEAKKKILIIRASSFSGS